MNQKEKEPPKQISFRCENEFYDVVSAKAKLEHITAAELTKKALVEYVHKDINMPNEILACLEQINSNVNKSNKQFNLFYSLFIFFLNYYFAIENREMNQWCTSTDRERKVERSQWSDESKDIFMKNLNSGKKTTDSFIKTFIKDPVARKAMDQHFANVLEDEVIS